MERDVAAMGRGRAVPPREDPARATAKGKAKGKAEELKAFLLLSVVMAPVLAVAVVSGYGFLVWMVQLIAGPPGPRI